MIILARKTFIIFLSIAFAGTLAGQKETGLFRDSLDGAFDISKYLFDLRGFLPIVAPLTEPALEYGFAAAGVYFIPKKKTSPQHFKMPDILGAAGGYTMNGSWLAGAGYMGFWKDNKIRYRGVMGYGKINLKYYGSGDNILARDPANFTIESYFFLQQALVRIAESKFLLGGNYILSKTRVTAFEESKLPSVDPRDFDLINSGISLLGEYETFNNILSPTKGIRMQLGYRSYLEFLGSDQNHGRMNFFTLAYFPVKEIWIAGFRLESQFATGSTPFYMNPFIDLRGIPVMRYQGQLTMLAETEQYFKVYKRWGLVGFAGYGRTVADADSFNVGSNSWNTGAGIRYLIARMLGLQMGIDVARGPETWAFYIVFGSAWLK